MAEFGYGYDKDYNNAKPYWKHFLFTAKQHIRWCDT